MVRLTPKSRAKQRQEQENSGSLAERLVTVSKPESVPSEAYRSLRTSLLYSLVDDPPKLITITSPGPREGKSTTCANLGIVLAQAGKDVILLDCDLRRPVIHRVFEIENRRGLVDVLASEGGIEDFWHEPARGLKVVASGPVPPNPAELLGSERFYKLMERLRRDFDYVLIDAPPVQLVSDAAIVAAQCDGVLLVLDAQNTRKTSVRRSIRSLESVGARVLGTIMNNVRASDAGYYGYTYSYTSD